MYYKTYEVESFSKELLEATRELGLNPTIDKIYDYVKFINKKFKIEGVELTLSYEDDNSRTSRGCYIDYSKEIRFYGTINLITVLHEIRHYIQFNSLVKCLFVTYNQREEEARGWSSSLFYALYPDKYLELSEQGKIKFI